MRMIKNITRYICIAILIFLISACEKYHEHFYSERNIESKRYIWNGDFTSTGDVLEFPAKDGEDFLLSAIDNAKSRIWIEIYSWTKMSNIYNAIKEAKNRWIDVRVILEWNVYNSPYINNSTKKFLENQKIPFVFADNNRYTFTHAKFWLIDNVYYISTWNWTKSFFSKNREYIYKWEDVITRDFLEKIFLADFAHKNFVQLSDIPDHIVISPLNSRQKIEDFIKKSEKIWIYVQTISDEKIINILLDKYKNSGVEIFICTANNESWKEKQKNFPDFWRIAKSPYLHAKIMIQDEKNIFLGSQNFTTNSLENNREMGIILQERPDLVKKIKQQMQKHCK